MSRRVLVPRLMDADNLNAQNKNAQAILRAWNSKDFRAVTLTYGAPEVEVANNARVEIIRLWRRHAWTARLFLSYLRRYDLIFYPGVEAADLAGLRWRRRLGYSAPLVSTLEGLVGDDRREADYSRLAGHPVHCQHVSAEVLERVDTLYDQSAHIIAISPFLARMGAARYGDRFSVLPLGVDTATFFPPPLRVAGREPLVVSAGTVYSRKRPAVFLDLAERFPTARFRWYGDGPDRRGLIEQVSTRRLSNVEFPGAKRPDHLAEEFRNADIFVLLSLAEGVPKVTQEAAACGLPLVIYGFYEAPTVVDGENGYVVWNDAELFERVGELIRDRERAASMGRRSGDIAKEWSWDVVAPHWEQQVLRLARAS